MQKILSVFLFLFFPFFIKAQAAPVPSDNDLYQRDSLMFARRGSLPKSIRIKLSHSHKDSVKYLKADTVFQNILDPLHKVENVGLRFSIRSLENQYGRSGHVQDSVQQAVQVLLNYAKNDSIRRMVNYLKEYLDQRTTDNALRVVKKQIEQDSIMSYVPDSASMKVEEDWRDEALNVIYEYIEKDPVNLWLREISRDSIQIGVKNFMNDSLGFWVNNGKMDFKRFWLKKSRRDSIGIWIQNAPNKSIRLFVDDDVYQESVQKTQKRGTRVRLEEKIPDEDYKLARIAKRERVHEIWKVGSIMGLGFTQGHVSNWAEGGESSVSTLTTINMFANYKKGNTQWDNTLDFKYGLLKTGENGFRKNEDRLEINTKYGQKAVDHWFYSFMFNMKTQLFRGYDYPSDADKKLVSSFMSPGYFLFSVGMDYKPKAGFSVLLSPMTGKWTYVRDTARIDQTKYGIDPDRRTKKETGLYAKVMHKWKITEDIILDNKLELYSSYTNKPKNIDVDWQMNLFLQVNQYINTKISTHLISDDDTGSQVQFKENLTVGVTYRF